MGINLHFRSILLSINIILTAVLFLQLNVYTLNKKEKEKLELYKNIIEELSYVEDRKKVEAIILNKKVQFKKGLILLNLNQPSQKDYFKNSLKKRYVNKGKAFLRKHLKFLKKVEKQYGVDKEIIVAILYIETNFNLRRAKNLVFNAFSSLAFANDPAIIEKNLKRLEIRYKNYPESYVKDQKQLLLWNSQRKAKWAMNELKLLIKVAKKMKKPILSLKGSFAGAMGWPQFIPSSYLNYAVDGNGDKKIDLYSLYDSISSIANYLNKNGFEKRDIRQQRKAIHHYNHSWGYVRFVLNYANKLKK